MKIPEKGLGLFPLQTVLFPQGRLPLQIFEPRYIEMINKCIKEDLAFGVVLIKEGTEVGDAAVPHRVGTIARIVDVARLADGRIKSYVTGDIELWRDENVDIAKAEPFARQASRSFQNYVNAIQTIAATEEQEGESEEKKELNAPKDPTLLSYLIAMNLQVSNSDKQSLLEARTTIARLRREILFMERELGLLRMVSDKGNRVLDQGTFSLN